jgi:uncharacterized protein YndB with AHSA1/START domain
MTMPNNPAIQPAERELTIIRIFDAPRELVFKAWTDSKHLAQWWGPKDFTNPVCEVDPRPGGALYIEMTGPDGVAYPVKGTFREIVPPERLVFTTTSFEDESGNPQLGGLNTVTFEDCEGKTRLTLHVTMFKDTAATAWALAGMSAGWTQSLDKLVDALARA